jgi:Glycosyltransferase WbsX
MKIKIVILSVIMCFVMSAEGHAQNYSIGVYYYPGWRSDYINWKDIKGLPGSRSPGKPWPDREPLLGYYPEEEPWVAEKHIEWASQYGINFFAYDWYWDGKQPEYDHALKNYLQAKNKSKLQFCLLWAYHIAILKNQKEFDDMVSYWFDNYFNQPTYYRIEDKPVIFIFSVAQLEANAKKFGESVKSLLKRADLAAKAKGYKGIYFVATTNDRPDSSLENKLLDEGFTAYTGWNYALAKGFRVDDYDLMVNGYLDYYTAASKTAKILPYIVPASPGYDERPWLGERAIVRNNPTPEKFERMLRSARQLMDTNDKIPKILMIEAWNEFAEGSYVEPTKKWGFQYLETIRKVFRQ